MCYGAVFVTTNVFKTSLLISFLTHSELSSNLQETLIDIEVSLVNSSENISSFLCEFVDANYTLIKRLCHKDIVVLSQFCAEVISSIIDTPENFIVLLIHCKS